MKQTRCMNCMGLIEDNAVSCPHCGYGQNAEQSMFGIKPGTILKGKYLVGRILGQGGFGITYVGYDLTLDVKVAIKEYFPMGCATRNYTISNQVQWNTTQFSREQWQQGSESFLKEARRLAKLDSLPGIVRVKDMFPENQTSYIIMEYIEGETLKERLKKTGTMSMRECITLLTPLMESLAKMHEKGLIHRDISPDNIMIMPDGNVCLLDFGAAKDLSYNQTLSSQQVAKKGFSPPEQYREKGKIGSWTDVYALCATIYYCITGKLVPDALDRLYEDTLTFSETDREQISETVEQILRDGLKIRTEERIQTVDVLLGTLEAEKMTQESADQNAGISETKGESEKFQWIGEQPYAHGEKETESIRFHRGDEETKEEPNPDGLKLEEGTESIRFHWGDEETEEEPAKKSKKKIVIASAVCVVLLLMIVGIFSGGGDTKKDTALFTNTLMADSVDDIFYGTVLGSSIDRNHIRSITFLDTLDEMPDTAWDASWDQDGTVMAWTKQNADYEKYYDLYIGAEGGVKARDCCRLFAGYRSVKTIMFQNCFDTSEVKDMESMFYNCGNLKELDAECLNTGKSMEMQWMFDGCKSLASLDVSGFDTSQVTDMRCMFGSCESLASLDVSGFDTSQVTDMSRMFDGCKSLASLDVSGFDTSQVTNMHGMFDVCKNLEDLDVSGFDTSQVTDMSWMFSNCTSLTTLDVSNFTIGRNTTIEYMFRECGVTAGQAGLKLTKNR